MSTTLFALDTSASTSSVRSYWDRVAEVFAKYKSEKPIYIAWDKTAKIITEKQVETEISKKCTINGGDTKPDELAKKIKELNFKGRLVLITDGQITAQTVNLTDTELVNWKFDSVDIELIANRIDLSVTSPFTRATKYNIKHNGKSISLGDSGITLNLDDYATVEKFQEGYEYLYSIIVAQNMGKMNANLRDELLKLQKQLLIQCALKNKDDTQGTPVLAALKRGDYDAAISLTRQISTVALGNDVPKEIGEKIQKLIKACTNPGVFSLDILSNGRVQRADDTKQLEAEQIEVLDSSDEKFECPIYYEQDIPALLIAKSKPILNDETKEIVDLLCNCPLYLLNFPHLVEKVKKAIDHPIGCNSINIKNGVFEDSPMTRNPILGAVPLGVDKSHVKAGNWTISRLFTGGKMIGNIQLWYTVIYHIAKQVSYLSENVDFINSMKSQLVYRMENYTSYMGLSGLPEFPLVKVPVGQAVWYCVASADLFSDVTIEQDRLRALNSISRILLDIISDLKYPILEEYTNRRIQLYTAFNFMMNEKFTPTRIANLLRAQYQNHYYCKSVDTYVFLDGTLEQGGIKAPELPPQLASLPLHELLYLFSKVSLHVKTNSVVIDRTIPNNTVPAAKYRYMYQKDTHNYPVVVCPATSRPYVVDRTKNIDWEASCSQEYGSLDSLISLNRHYLSYMEATGKFPELEEFLVFIAAREAGSIRQRDTLPINILNIFNAVNNEFQTSFTQLEKHLGRKVVPKDVTSRGNAASNKALRKTIEDKWLAGTYDTY